MLAFILSILLFTNLLQASNNFSKDDSLKLFRIGFEFQETHNLCPWAPQHLDIQNKNIFCVKNSNGRILWNLTIDWKDLEFVTEPFYSTEKEELYLAIETIEEACSLLSRLAKKYHKCNHTITFYTWMKSLEKSSKDGRFFFECLDAFESVKLSSIQLSLDFSAKFLPQMTLQHHLESTINLTMGLFSDNLDSGNQVCMVSSQLESSGAATAIEVIKELFQPKPTSDDKEESEWDGKTPIYYSSEDIFCFPSITSRKEGFLFLHMMTCCDLARSSKVLEEGIKSIYRDVFDKTGQVNPKSYVHLLSRRPFSSMWRDIAEESLYVDFFRSRANQAFIDSYTTKFKQLNYGEIYDSDLTQNTYFQCFGSVQSEEFCQLLNIGVLSTSMLLSISDQEKRKQVQNIFDSYFDDAIKSVDKPSTVKRYVFDLASNVLDKNTNHDILSPPHFVSDCDSMGAFKNDQHEINYGEAIVEFRDISRISQRALNKIAEQLKLFNSIKRGEFLCANNDEGTNKYSLQDQIKGLIFYTEVLLAG